MVVYLQRLSDGMKQMDIRTVPNLTIHIKTMSDNTKLNYTSATNSVSSICNEHAVVKALTRSSPFPYLGTETVNTVGMELPSVFMTVKVIVRIVVEGIGSDRYMKGSKVMDTFLQTGQTSVDLY